MSIDQKIRFAKTLTVSTASSQIAEGMSSREIVIKACDLVEALEAERQERWGTEAA